VDTPCPSCGGTGFTIRTREGGTTEALRCRCATRDRGEGLLKRAGIPRRYDHCTLDSFSPITPSLRIALEHARGWVLRWGDPHLKQGILFQGGPGTGKTHLAVGMVRDLAVRKGARVLFWEQRDLLKSLQGTFDADAGIRESEVLEPAVEADVLVLDDVGAGRTSAWARDVLHDVISQRYNEERHLVITTNCLIGDEENLPPSRKMMAEGTTLRDRLGEALMSRLYEMCLIVRLDSTDYRKSMLNAHIQMPGERNR